MAINYTALQGVAERLIRENGKTAQLVSVGPPSGPPWDPQPGVEIEQNVFLVETMYSMFHRDDSFIQVGDKTGIISTESGVVPELSVHDIQIGGTRYKLVDVQPLIPGPVTMLYKFTARI